MKHFTFILVIVLALSQLSFPAKACRCLPPNIKSSYFFSVRVIIGRVLKVKFCPLDGKGCFEPKGDSIPPNGRLYHTIRVIRSYKGCVPRRSKIVAQTASSGATCGLPLRVGSRWYLNLSGKDNNFNSCGYNRRPKDLTSSDRKFLRSRLQCCRKGSTTSGRCRCNDGTLPVNCFVDPCRFAKRPCKEAEVCKANYCGGCNAEWFKKGGVEPACLS